MKTIYILTAIIFCVSLCTAENVSKQKIPMPPWTETTGAPTSSFEVLDYLFQVLPLMSENTMEEINEALDQNASASMLLAIIYNENLNRQLIDFDNSGTNEEASCFSALAELMNTLNLYESQWQHHFGDYGNFWSLGSGNSNSLAYMLKQIIDLEELIARAEDPNDMFEDIENYKYVLNLPGAAYTIFTRAFYFTNRDIYQRAKPLLELLTSDQNRNLFVKGGAHFWLGYLYHRFYKEYDKALENLYVVHAHPACLVNTDWSYILTSRIFEERGKTNTALALLSIKIPTMDHQVEEIRKAWKCFDILWKQNDVTNAFLQVARVMCAQQVSISESSNTIFTTKNFLYYAKNKFSGKFSETNYNSIVHSIVSSKDYMSYEIEIIRKALMGQEQMKNNPFVTDMLLHAWPLIEEVDSSVLTNRMLCNNIFGQKRRTDIILE